MRCLEEPVQCPVIESKKRNSWRHLSRGKCSTAKLVDAADILADNSTLLFLLVTCNEGILCSGRGRGGLRDDGDATRNTIRNKCCKSRIGASNGVDCTVRRNSE